jgi:hypothetical protein
MFETADRSRFFKPERFSLHFYFMNSSKINNVKIHFHMQYNFTFLCVNAFLSETKYSK